MIDDLPGDDRAKRDRTARLLMVVQILRANGTRGVTPAEIAKRTGMAKRRVYRDQNAIGGELGIPAWSEGGRWGVDAEAFLPPLRLTLSEAMAIFLSARLLARYMDKHDPVLASAFTKLEEGLPASLRDHVERIGCSHHQLRVLGAEMSRYRCRIFRLIESELGKAD